MTDLADTKQLVLQFFTKDIIDYAIRNVSLSKDGQIVVECVHPISTQLTSVNGVPIVYAMVTDTEEVEHG